MTPLGPTLQVQEAPTAPAVRASTGSFDSLQINGCLAFVFLWLLSWLKIPKILFCLYVHFPKANHFPVEFVDFVFAVFCFYFSPWDSFTWLLEEYIAYIWFLTYRDTIGIARLVIFSVQKQDVFGSRIFFQPQPCWFFANSGRVGNLRM